MCELSHVLLYRVVRKYENERCDKYDFHEVMGRRTNGVTKPSVTNFYDRLSFFLTVGVTTTKRLNTL